jgi:hypothetical protein
MTSQYPAKIDDNITLPVSLDNSTLVRANVLNDLRGAIIAIESAMGVNPASVYGTVRERLNTIENALTSITIGGGGITVGGDLSGSSISQIVVGLQGNAISNISPTDGYVLTWKSSTSKWTPSSAASGFAAGGDLTGSSTSQQVISLTGSAGVVSVPTASIAFNTIPATSGDIRLSNISSIQSRTFVDNANIIMMATDATDSLFIGTNNSWTEQTIGLNMYASSTVALGLGALTHLYIISGFTESWVPIIGSGTGSSPYGVHGVGTQAMADANQTPASTIYQYNTIVTTDAITANRTLTLPTATDVAGYTKIIDNTCAGAFAVVVTTGAGVTATINNGTKGIVLIDSRGVTLVGAPTLPTRYELNLASGLFSTTSTTFTRTGGRQIDMSIFPATIGALARTVAFSADIDMTAGATSVEIQLYDITHSVAVTSTDLTSSSTTNTRVTSGSLTVGSSAGNIRSDVATQYELQFKMNGGGGSDAVFLTNSRLVITYA